MAAHITRMSSSSHLVLLLANTIVLFNRFRSHLDSAHPAAGDHVSPSFLPRLRELDMVWKLQLEVMDRHTESESDVNASSLDNATSKLLRENAVLKRRMDACQFQHYLSTMSELASHAQAPNMPKI
ncbi:hypothetical protein AC578_1192 [Pseudocercospora eumusae]|uniref:Uncharacterized protein n=1 Tax=Pseudocercospora eumusae TaxID=321146 RepID=A0A139H0B3_9PEZI|nr:hypothetical protein AC578_1192 [Pseudocercospora eumusae]